METVELLVQIFGYPLWFAKLLAEHFPLHFTITEEMEIEDSWTQIIGGHLSRAREKIKDNPNLAGFLEPCPLDAQLLAFAQSVGRCEESDLIRIHTFFCHRCAEKYSRLIWEEAILEDLRNIQNNCCPENDIIFGHFQFIMRNPEIAEESEPLYKRIHQFGYPEFMLLVMGHLNHCYRCREIFTELQRAGDEVDKEDQVLDQIEQQLKNLPSN